MLSEQMIKKLANDTLLTKLHDYLLTYDIGPMERLKRSIALVDFWVAEGDRFKKFKEGLVKDDALVMENCCRYFEYWYKLKLICEGKELSAENLSNINLDEALEFRDSVLGITPDGD